MSIGDRLKKVRKHLGLSQTDIGEIIQTGRTTYSGYESDKQSISADHLRLISEKFPQINIDWIVTGRGSLSLSNSSGENDEKTDKVIAQPEKMKKALDLLTESIGEMQNNKLSMIEGEIKKLWAAIEAPKE